VIKVILSGRLGNILFQYSAGRQLAIKNNTSLLLDLSENYQRDDIFAFRIQRLLQSLSIQGELFNPIPWTLIHKTVQHAGFGKVLHPKGIFQHEELFFNPRVLDLRDGCSLKGYFQSPKYFQEIAGVIKEDLRPRHSLEAPDFLEYRDKIRQTNSVSIHVRRGDYLQYPNRNLLDLWYYKRAMEYFFEREQGVQFFIFSDDITWCRQNFLFEKMNFITLRDTKRNPLADLFLMQSCKHNIISNSAYAWWGAWLNENPGNIVLAPNQWKKMNNKVMNRKILDDIYPPQWTLLEVEKITF